MTRNKITTAINKALDVSRFVVYQALAAGITILLAPQIINITGLEGYAQYITYITITSVFAQFITFSPALQIQQQYKESGKKLNIGNTILASGIISFVFATPLAIAVNVFNLESNSSFLKIFNYSILSFSSFAIYQIIIAYLIMLGEEKKWGGLYLLFNVLPYVLAMVLDKITDRQFDIKTIDTVARYLVITAYLPKYMKNTELEEGVSICKELFTRGRQIQPHIVTGFFTGYLDKLIATYVVGGAASGVYILISQMVQVLRMFIDSMNKIIVPATFDSLKDEKKSESFCNTESDDKIKTADSLILIAVIVLLASMPISFAYLGMNLAFNNVLVMLMLVVGCLAHYIYLKKVAIIYYHDKNWQVSKITLTSFVVTLLFILLKLDSLTALYLSFVSMVGSIVMAAISINAVKNVQKNI